MAMPSTGAEGLLRFLSSTGDSQAEFLERLARALAPCGEAGLTFTDAMERSGAPRGLFLDILSRAVSGGLVERFTGPDGSERLKLTPGAASLYA